jgi:hypothetical protein
MSGPGHGYDRDEGDSSEDSALKGSNVFDNSEMQTTKHASLSNTSQYDPEKEKRAGLATGPLEL